jgi:hypothetical protein
MVLRTAGVFLIVAGVLSGIVLLLSPFGATLTISTAQFWFFYMLCFIGGFVLYALGAPKSSTERILKLAGGILVFTGLCAAICLLLRSIAILPTADSSDQLWLLFLVCLPLGVLATLVGDNWTNLRKIRKSERLNDAVAQASLSMKDKSRGPRASGNARDQFPPKGDVGAPNTGTQADA